MAKLVKKNTKGYNYKYADIAEVHNFLEENGWDYYQYVEVYNGNDYIMTVPIIDGVEQPARRGCRIVEATLKGVDNPAQEQGSAITYARRYSLLMAFGLATTDDDAACLSRKKQEPFVIAGGTGASGGSGNVAEVVIRPINKNEMDALKLLITETKTDISEIAKYYKVKDLKDLNNVQWVECMKILDKKDKK